MKKEAADLRNGLLQYEINGNLNKLIAPAIKALTGIKPDTDLIVHAYSVLHSPPEGSSFVEQLKHEGIPSLEKLVFFEERDNTPFKIYMQRSLNPLVSEGKLKSNGMSFMAVFMFVEGISILTFIDGQPIPEELTNNNIMAVEAKNFSDHYDWDTVYEVFKEL